MLFVITSQSWSLWKKLQRMALSYYVLPPKSTARLFNSTQVLWNLQISQNNDDVPSISMYTSIIFVSMYKAVKLKFIQQPPNFKLPTLPQRPYHRIFLLDIKKKFLVCNLKCLLRGSVTILCNCILSWKAYFFVVCLSPNHIQLIVTSEFDATSPNHVSSIPLSPYQIFVLCLHKICVAHYFMCNSPTQTTTGDLVVFTQIKYFSTLLLKLI